MIGWLGKWKSIPNSKLFIHLLGCLIDKQVLFRHNNVICLLNCCVGLLQLRFCDYHFTKYTVLSVLSLFHSTVGLEQRQAAMTTRASKRPRSTTNFDIVSCLWRGREEVVKGRGEIVGTRGKEEKGEERGYRGKGRASLCGGQREDPFPVLEES